MHLLQLLVHLNGIGLLAAALPLVAIFLLWLSDSLLAALLGCQAKNRQNHKLRVGVTRDNSQGQRYLLSPYSNEGSKILNSDRAAG